MSIPQPARTAATMPRSGIRALMDRAWATPGAIHLEVGEPSFATPEHIMRAADTAAHSGWTHYVPNAGVPDLREELARKLRSHNGIDADPEQVVVTAGCAEALYVSLLSVTEPGDEVLLPDPGWPNFAMIAHLLHLRVRYYRLRPDLDFAPDPQEIDRLCGPATRVMILNSPSNPLGSVTPAQVLAQIGTIADRHGLWLISDECYDAITFEPVFASTAVLADPARVLSCYSFSKTHAMTGWRVGYIAAPPQVAQVLQKMQEPVVACVNAPAQQAALAALTGPQDHVTEMVAAYRRRRDALVALLADEGLACRPPDGAFYAWVSLVGCPFGSQEFAERLLSEQGVAIAPGAAFGPSGEGWARLSLAADEQDLLDGTARLAAFVRKHGDT